MTCRSPNRLTRRDVLRLAVGVPLVGLAPRALSARGLDVASLQRAPGRVIAADGADASRVRLVRKWEGPRCQARVKNTGRSAVALAESMA